MRHRARSFVWLALGIGGFACAPQPIPVAGPPARVTTVSIHQSQNAPESSTTPQPEQRAGRIAAERLPELRGTMVERVTRGGFDYLRIRLAETRDVARFTGRPLTTRCEAKPSCFGVWSEENALLIRSKAGEAPPEAVVLRAQVSAEHTTLATGLEQRVVLEGTPESKPRSNLVKDFELGLAHFLERFATEEPYVAFAAARIRKRWATPSEASRRDAAARSRDELSSLMDFYTGRTEIERALASRRALGIDAKSKYPGRSVPISKIANVTAQPRDYAALASGAGYRSDPVLSPLAPSLPPDTLSVEFATVRDLVQLPRWIDEHFDEMGRALERQPGHYRLIERYRQQLLVQPSKLAEQLGQVAAGGVAIVIGDPYLREGTDVSLVFEVKQQSVLETVLARYVADARVADPQVESKSLLMEGIEVALHENPNGSVRRYQAIVGSRLYLSNSPGRMAQLLRIAQGKAQSLAKSEDYRWSRRGSPFDARRERAYAFFGDEFVKSTTGARSKILESRRLRAQSELRGVEFAAMLARLMDGAEAASIEDLLRSGWMRREDLVHFDGKKITYTKEDGARSNWGRASELVPIVDLSIETADPAEVAAYDRFRSSYEGEWSGAVDPTSLIVLRGESEAELNAELRILPISAQGTLGRSFRDMLRSVGIAQVSPGASSDGVSVSLALSDDAGVRQLADQFLLGHSRRSQLSLGFLGNWIKAGLGDDPILYGMGLAERAIPELPPPPSPEGNDDTQYEAERLRRQQFGFEQNLERMPVWAMVHVRSPVVFATALAALRVLVQENLEDWVVFAKDPAYRGMGVTRVEVRPGGTAVDHVTIYFALARDTLVLAFRRESLEQRIEDVLAGRIPTPTPVGRNGAAQLHLDLSKKQGATLSALLTGLLQRPSLIAHEGACRALSLLALGLGDDAANALDGAKAMRLLGYEPASPNGPGLRMSEGDCVHPVYGTLLEPNLPKVTDTSSSLHSAIERLRGLRFGISVVPRGTEQEFIGTFRMRVEPMP